MTVDGSDSALLAAQMEALRRRMLEAETPTRPAWDAFPTEARASARNLIHHLAQRREDQASLRERLAARGLSTLEREEDHVLASVEAVLRALAAPGPEPSSEAPLGREEARMLHARRATAALGPAPEGSTRIGVTVDEGTLAPGSIERLLAAGAGLFRIDGRATGRPALGPHIARVRDASARTGHSCRILLELPGRNLRTALGPAGPHVLKLKPARGPTGRVLHPARLWLTAKLEDIPAEGSRDPHVLIDAAWIGRSREGDHVRLVDARGSSRRLEIVREAGSARLALAFKTVYLIPETVLRLRARSGQGPSASPTAIPALPPSFHVDEGDGLILTARVSSARDAGRDGEGNVSSPARIGCTRAEPFRELRVGHRVFLDQGSIEAVVGRTGQDEVEVVVTRVHGRGTLWSDRVIHFPDTPIPLPGFTAADREVMERTGADLVSLPYAERPEDVREIRAELAASGAAETGIVLAIQSRSGYEALPSLLLAALAHGPAAIMAVPEDLSVELGEACLAEAREEILASCRAAHVPVLWATGTLEPTGRARRPTVGVGEAAAAARADAVLLGAGSHVEDAVGSLHAHFRRAQGGSRPAPELRPPTA